MENSIRGIRLGLVVRTFHDQDEPVPVVEAVGVAKRDMERVGSYVVAELKKVPRVPRVQAGRVTDIKLACRVSNC